MTRKRFMRILRAVYPSESAVRGFALVVRFNNDSYGNALNTVRECISASYKALGIPLPRELRKGRGKA